MSFTIADQLSREIEAWAHDVQRIQALSRTQPHIFAEQKDELARRARRLAAELRNTFAVPATQFRTGLVVSARGKPARVERRRGGEPFPIRLRA